MATIRPLGLSDRSLVEDYLRRYPPEISELTFTNLFVWRSSRPIWLAEAENTVVFITESGGKDSSTRVILGPALGEALPLTVADALDVEIEGFVRLPEDTAGLLRKAGLKVEADRNNWDYVYSVSDLAELKGRHYHKKRNLIKQCLAAHKCVYEPITSQQISECQDMQDRWCQSRECGKNPGLCNEYTAIRETFSHYDTFGVFGGSIRVDGKIEAYAIGEKMSPGTAVCHFEKAMSGVQGLSQLINQWFAVHALKGFQFVNREQDLGIAGLRQAKESYYPHHMVKKFRATRKPGDSVLPALRSPQECAKHAGNTA